MVEAQRLEYLPTDLDLEGLNPAKPSAGSLLPIFSFPTFLHNYVECSKSGP